MTKITIFNRLIVKFLKVRKTQGAENGIILGDFNASGAYVKTKDWQTNRLRGSEFEWLIPDHMDTTATNTLAAYDRSLLT